MRKSLFVISFLSALFCLTSCASLSKGKVTKCEPKDNNSVFLCGILTAEGTGFDKYYGKVSVNGFHTKGIEINIKDLNTGKIVRTKTGENGFFYIPNASAGHKYKLVDATVKDEADGYSTWITFPLDQTRISICKVKQGTVICDIRITYKKDGPWRWVDPGESYRVKQVFSMQYPDSKWNEYNFEYSF